jgi:hypothetical protein
LNTSEFKLLKLLFSCLNLISFSDSAAFSAFFPGRVDGVFLLRLAGAAGLAVDLRDRFFGAVVS